MKVGKTSLIFLIAGVIIVAGGGLGFSHSQQTEQQELLQKRLALAKQKMALVKTDDLEAQKSSLVLEIQKRNAQLESSKQALVNSDDSITASSTILETAKSYGIDVISMSSKGESPSDLYGIKCTVLPVSLQVAGNINSISDFVCGLRQKFPTSVISSVQIASQAPKPEPSPAPDAEPAPEPEAGPTPAPTPTPNPNPGDATPLPPEFKPVVVAEKNATASINMTIYSYEGG